MAPSQHPRGAIYPSGICTPQPALPRVLAQVEHPPLLSATLLGSWGTPRTQTKRVRSCHGARPKHVPEPGIVSCERGVVVSCPIYCITNTSAAPSLSSLRPGGGVALHIHTIIYQALLPHLCFGACLHFYLGKSSAFSCLVDLSRIVHTHATIYAFYGQVLRNTNDFLGRGGKGCFSRNRLVLRFSVDHY